MKKIVIIGCGNVGMAYAYALITSTTPFDELALIDLNKKYAIGQAQDLNDALPYCPNYHKIYGGSYADCNDADIIVLCAGRNQEKGETRQDLIDKNYNVFKSIIDQIQKTKFKGIMIVATNPLDVMTTITQKLSNFNPKKIIGSGTVLDTARLKYNLGKIININPRHVHAYVLGEHGDSEFIAWDLCLIGMNEINSYLTKSEQDKMTKEIRQCAYDIIDKKGYTNFGIGMSLVKITNAILTNSHEVLTVSVYDKAQDIYYSRPAVINKNGIQEIIPLKLTPKYEELLQKSIQSIKNCYAQIKLEKIGK